jgi:hypothetical protein
VASRPRLAWAALGFGLAALASSWNPAAAPFGLAVGLAAALLSVRALLAGDRRWPAGLGLVASLAAVATSLAVLALTAGVGRQQPAQSSLVEQPSRGEAATALDDAAAGSQEGRERARRELQKLPPERSQPPSN